MGETTTINVKTLKGMVKRQAEAEAENKSLHKTLAGLKSKNQKQRNEIGRLSQSLSRCAEEKAMILRELQFARGNPIHDRQDERQQISDWLHRIGLSDMGEKILNEEHKQEFEE